MGWGNTAREIMLSDEPWKTNMMFFGYDNLISSCCYIA